MKIIGDIEIDKATLWGIGIVMGFVFFVFTVIMVYQTLLNEEWLMYRNARKNKSAGEFRVYLATFPEGRYFKYAQRELRMLNLREYREFLSLISGQVKECLRVARGYGSRGLRVKISGGDYAEAMEDNREELDIKGVLKDIHANNIKIDKFLATGSTSDPRFSDLYDATHALYQASLKLYDLVVLPPPSLDGYADQVNHAFNDFLSLKGAANVALVALITEFSVANTDEDLAERREAF